MNLRYLFSFPHSQGVQGASSAASTTHNIRHVCGGERSRRVTFSYSVQSHCLLVGGGINCRAPRYDYAREQLFCRCFIVTEPS